MQPALLSQFSPQLLAMACEGLASMDYSPGDRAIASLFAQFEASMGEAKLMDCTTMLSALVLWRSVPQGALGPACCLKLLQAVEVRWSQGSISMWYLAGKVAPALRHIIRAARDAPEVQALANRLLLRCYLAIEQGNAVHLQARLRDGGL